MSEQTKPKPGTGTLKRGIKIGETFHREFELRPATTGDIFEAEKVTDADKTLTFTGALLCRQLVRIGEYKGPFTLAILAKLPPADFGRLREAQQELAAEGEDEQLG